MSEFCEIEEKLSKCKTKDAALSELVQVPIEEAITAVKNKPNLKKILSELKFNGSFSKSSYGKDWVLLTPQLSDPSNQEHERLFNEFEKGRLTIEIVSKGFLIYTDLLKSLKTKYGIESVAIYSTKSRENSFLNTSRVDSVIVYFAL